MSPRLHISLVFIARFTIAMLGILFLWMLLLKPQDSSWQRLQEGQALRVAMDPSFPPFDTVTAEGQMAGFDVALARELGRRMSVHVTFIPIAFDGLVDAVIAGRADAVISAFPLDKRLTENVRYSHPYFEAGLVMVTRANSQMTAPGQLADVTVAAEWGGDGDVWSREHKLPTILRTETPNESLNAVLDKRADAAIVDAVSAALYPKPGLLMHTPPLVSEPYVIVLPKQAPRLAKAVDTALSDMMTDGTWEMLAEEYFPNPPIPLLMKTPTRNQ